MPTIAELQVKVDTRPVSEATRELNNFADAANKAQRAADGFQGETTGGGGLAPQSETNKVKNLSEAIDQQAAKLGQLAQQRKALDASGMKNTDTLEYERLNRIIDANIALVERQGNAVSRLSAAQDRDVAKKEQIARAEVRLQENSIKASERKDLVLTNAAAREQRSIEQTINGLDRQIKAQNDYNKAVENLSKARALSGMGGPSDGRTVISGAEFDSYVKLAAAQRDAKLAIQDNSAEITRVQSKLDTYTATLGRAERAEVEYARAVGVLNEAQRLGLVTQDQYDQKLSAFASKRDSMVAAANAGARSEEQLARQLDRIMGKYDPLTRATQNYNNAVKILSDGLQNGVINADQFNKTLTQQVSALDAAKAQADGVGMISKGYEDALRSVLPYRAELENLETQQRRLDAAQKAGLVTTPQQIRDYKQASEAIKQQSEHYRRLIKDTNDNTMSAKAQAAAMRGVPAQITDIVVSLQGGQAPLTVLLQQGGQLKDMFGGVGAAAKALGTTLLGMITPINVIATAIAALGLAAYQGGNELNAFNKALVQTRGVSGASANDFTNMRTELEGVGATAGKAAEALTLMEASGKIAVTQFSDIGEAAILMQKATGQALDETVSDFASLGKDPVNAAVTLDEKYRFLTASVLAQASALEEQGRKQEAVQLLQGKMAEAATEAAKSMIEEAGWIEQAWNGVKSAVTGVWDAMKNLGRESTAASELNDVLEKQAAIRHELRDNEAALGRNKRFQELEVERRILQARVDGEKQLADYQAKSERNRQSDVAYVKTLDAGYSGFISTLDKVQGKQEALNRVMEEQAKHRQRARDENRELTAQEIKMMDAQLGAAKKELQDAKDAKAKEGGRTPVDTRELTETKVNLDAIKSEYDRYYKQVTALGEANVVSSEATYRSQMAILEAQKNAVTEAFGTQIKELENLQNRKGNTSAQSISLDNQMTKAEAARAKAIEEIQAKQEQATIRFQGDIEKRKAAIQSYTDAMREQVRAMDERGLRDAALVGRGDRQGNVAGQQFDNDLWYAKEKRRLSEALAANKMDDNEYQQKYAELTKAHSDMTDKIIENDQRIQDANADWTNGFTAAVENAQDAGMNFAGNMEAALTGAFKSAGDAFGTFVTTGKLSFSDLASSIISDMAKIAAQQAMMGALGAMFGALGGFSFGGAGNGLTPGSAGYNSSNLGASAAGYGPKYFAKGGAFSGGTQYFANGSAFSNGIFNNPTPFSMANGNTGVMGEAGPEAIMPLTRTSSGDLGVRMVGGNGGGSATMVNVVVNVTEGSAQSSSDGGADWDAFGSELGSFVDQRVYTIINKETRPGKSLQPQK